MSVPTECRIVFAGTPDFSVPSLQALIDSNFKPIAVFTQPDRPAGRGRKLTAPPVKELAESAAIPVFQPATLKTEDAQQQLQALAPDLLIVIAYGLILPPAVLAMPRLGCINVHASLLPRFRGAAPIQRAILAGDQMTGITLMEMTAGLDEGPMLAKRDCEILSTDTSASLHDRLAGFGAELLLQALPDIINGQLVAEPQDDNAANYAHKLTKTEATINWQQHDALAIERAIRAYNPWPVAVSFLVGQRVRFWQASFAEEQAAAATEPGTIIGLSKDSIQVATINGILTLEKLQLAGGKVLTASQLLQTKQGQALFKVGDRFTSLEG